MRLPNFGAVTGSLLALILTGSGGRNVFTPLDPPADGAVIKLNALGKQLYAAGKLEESHQSFRSAAAQSRFGAEKSMNWANAGLCSLSLMRFGRALDELLRAKTIAENARLPRQYAVAMNNLGNLYIHMGQPGNAVRVAREALASSASRSDLKLHGQLLSQLADGLAELDRLAEAEPIYRQAIQELMDVADFDSAARILGAFGDESLKAGRLAQAESALAEGLWLVRIHRITSSASILSELGTLKARSGDIRSAEALFAAALEFPNLTPKWGIFAERGRARLISGNLRGAFADFSASRQIAAQMRADVVPADFDRVALETGIAPRMEGLVEAGNRLFGETRQLKILIETFDAAESDRRWSLRMLVPSLDDWRSRLPEHYWEVLARYQSLDRKVIPKIEKDNDADRLREELQSIESRAAGNNDAQLINESPLLRVKRMLDRESVLFSFYLSSKNTAWVWAVDREHVDVYPIPNPSKIELEVAKFSRAIIEGAPSAQLGSEIYEALFGKVPQTYLRHKRWLLELDGSLHQLPFAALVTNGDQAHPQYLVERAALQSIPSILLLERGNISPEGSFLGVGDPIYNMADERYSGRKRGADFFLPRLLSTAGEIDACARVWAPQKSPKTQLLKGGEARPDAFWNATRRNPAIIHFATHVIEAPGEFRSGMIALSLNSQGVMDLLGPRQIQARSISSSLVVMDGCSSGQAQSLPIAGLMGLTRSWIGAGAGAVMATQWNIPDNDETQHLMERFYGSLHASPEKGPAFALRDAQLLELRKPNSSPVQWAGYFLLGKTI